MNQSITYLSFGAPGIQEIIVILIILGVLIGPLVIAAIVWFVYLKQKKKPPTLPQQPEKMQNDEQDSER